MRKQLWFSILAAALAVGGCKKTQDDTHGAAKQVEKSVEGVDQQQKDLDKTEANKNATPDDMTKAKGDVQSAKDDLAAARDKYAITAHDRLQQLDIKINELAERADAKSKEALTAIRAERDSLAQMVDSAKTQMATGWDDFTKGVDHRFDQIEKSVNDALK